MMPTKPAAPATGKLIRASLNASSLSVRTRCKRLMSPHATRSPVALQFVESRFERANLQPWSFIAKRLHVAAALEPQREQRHRDGIERASAIPGFQLSNRRAELFCARGLRPLELLPFIY